MALDLGELFAVADINDAPFQAKYTRLVRQFTDLGAQAERAAAGTATLDEAYAGLSTSAGAASASVGRAARTTATSATAEERAARAAQQHAAAVARVSTMMDELAGTTQREQAATLRAVAAQERYDELLASGTASTRQLASAQAGLIGAQRGVTASQDAAAASSRRLGGAMGGTLKMARDLGLLLGAFEAVKKVIDIGKEAGSFQQQMLMIQTNAGASSAEVRAMSSAVLAMAGPLATSPDKLAEALYHVEQNGLRGKDALDALRVGTEGAKIGMADVEDTTNTMTIAMASGIKGVRNLQQTMGFMIATVGTGDMRLKDLNEALSGGILSVAKGFGASLRDVAAVLATLGDNGIRGKDAATALRQTLMGFASPAKGGVDALRSVGLSMTDLGDAMEKHGLVYAMNDLNEHMKAAGVTGNKVGGFITRAFGRKAGAGIAVVMGETDRLNTKFAEAQKGAQNFEARWEATTRTAKFQFQELSAGFQAEAVKMASAAIPVATVVAGQLGGALHDIIHVVGQVGSAFTPVFQLAGVAVAGAAFALHGIAAALSAIAPVIKVVAAAWAGMFLGQAAWRGAVALLGAIGSAFETMQVKALYAQDAISAGWARMGGAASAAAAETGAAAAAIGAEAEGASEAVVASGEAAEIGWAGLAGPLGAAALGVFAVVSMFHKSTGASKEATDAAKAYSDALASGSRSELVDSISQQLKDNKLPDLLKQLNDGLGRTAFTGGQFVTALSGGAKPMDALRARLQAVIKAGTSYMTVQRGAAEVQIAKATPAAEAATKALGHLNTQYDTLTKTAQKDLLDTKSFAGAAGAIQKTATATQLGTDAAKQYATMAGYMVDKNGIVAASQRVVNASVDGVAHAYATATTAGSAYLSALDTFSKSAGTSADRAALIGATLQAGNGDALAYAGAMSAAASANHQFFADVRSNAKTAKESLRGYLDSVINLKTGTIDYSRAGAGPLIADLQGIQSAAMQAAEATYQHARATEGGKRAADDAYRVYVSETRGSLIDQATKLGLTSGEAKKLADKYFGMPKHVKTLIEQAGANPILTVLNRIGRLLANLTGQPWSIDVVENVRQVGSALGLKPGQSLFGVGGSAAGSASWTRDGKLPPGLSTVGERGWELVSTDARGRSEVLPHAQSVAMTGLPNHLPGFAGGTGNNARQNEAAIARALRAAFGFTWNQSAGFLGNFMVESGLNPRAHNQRENAHGFAQWEQGRWVALQRFAAHMGASAQSTRAQVAFLVHELRQTNLPAQIRRMHDPARIAALVDAQYERSAGTTRAQRIAAARMFAGHRVPLAAAAAGDLPLPGRIIVRHGAVPTRITRSGEDWVYNGIRYASERAALNARTRAEQHGGKTHYIFNGITYSSLTAAQNAQVRAAKQERKAEGEVRTRDIPAFVRALLGTTANLRSAEQALTKAARAAGLTHTALARVAASERRLNALSVQRNRIAGRLGAPTSTRQTAWERLEAARSDYTGERSNVRSTIAGGFDLAQAGRSSGTGVTIASILGDAGQQRANAELFNRQLTRLHRMGLGKQELQQLAEKGFAGAESSTLALLGASRGQIRQLNRNVTGLGTAAGRTGTFAADLLYGKDVRTATQRVHQLQAQERRVDRRIERIGQNIVATIRHGLGLPTPGRHPAAHHGPNGQHGWGRGPHGWGGPTHLTVVDADGKLMGTLRVEAQRAAAHHSKTTARAVHLHAGRP